MLYRCNNGFPRFAAHSYARLRRGQCGKAGFQPVSTGFPRFAVRSHVPLGRGSIRVRPLQPVFNGLTRPRL